MHTIHSIHYIFGEREGESIRGRFTCHDACFSGRDFVVKKESSITRIEHTEDKNWKRIHAFSFLKKWGFFFFNGKIKK